ncbi:unnamed protein product, partial [Larinioides sclopetarius]
ITRLLVCINVHHQRIFVTALSLEKCINTKNTFVSLKHRGHVGAVLTSIKVLFISTK